VTITPTEPDALTEMAQLHPSRRFRQAIVARKAPSGRILLRRAMPRPPMAARPDDPPALLARGILRERVARRFPTERFHAAPLIERALLEMLELRRVQNVPAPGGCP
jgi:hypothetical protein